jgi:hypothetical protein
MLDKKRKRRQLLLLAICVLALGLRLLALGYGLPATYNPDETPIMNRALAFAKGDLNPHNFLYPSLYFYALFAWEVLFFAAGRVAGLYDSVDAFQREFFTNPSRLFLAGRALTALFGVAAVPALYMFGKRLYGYAAGLVAAAFLAVAPVAVRDAHYVKLDVPVAFFVVLTHVVLARLVTDTRAAQRPRTWALAGFFAGLTVSTHYYAAFIVLPVAAAALVEGQRAGQWARAAKMLALAAVATLAGFIAGTPFFFFEPQIAMRDIVAVREIDIDRAVESTGAFTSFGRYAEILFRDAVGWPVCLLAAAGFVWALIADWRRGLILGTFTFAFLMFVANTVPMSRYLNVILPLFGLAAAYTVVRMSSAFGARSTAAAAVMTVLAMTPGMVTSVKTDLFFREADTRTIAREYIETRIPGGTSFLVQPYSPPVRRSRESLVEAFRKNLGSENKASIKFQMMLAAPIAEPSYIYISPKAFGESTSLTPLRDLGIQYVILKTGNVPNPALAGLEAALAREGERIASFTPYRASASARERTQVPPYLHNTAARIDPALERPGPGLEIWDIQLDRRR